ncbi:MAG: hypothetical protein QME81_05675 [bacterium]|nr:hypothetical protein [bacterium]
MQMVAQYHQELMEEIKDLPEDEFPNLLQIIHLFKTSIISQRQKWEHNFAQELVAWDRLSDEALITLEQEIEDEGR